MCESRQHIMKEGSLNAQISSRFSIWLDINIWLDIELADIKGRRQRLRDIYSLSPAETLINLGLEWMMMIHKY